MIVNAQFLKKDEDRAKGDMAVANDYYMKQTEVLDNACGVIACIHAILNNLGEGDKKIALKDDGVLTNFLKSAKDLSAADRATALENFKEFQTVHTKYANQGGSEMPSDQEGVKHHFTAFVVNSAG